MSFPGAYLLSIISICGLTGAAVRLRFGALGEGSRRTVARLAMLVGTIACAWDNLAVLGGLWRYDPASLLGVQLGASPIETSLLGASVAAVLSAWTIGVRGELLDERSEHQRPRIEQDQDEHPRREPVEQASARRPPFAGG